MNRLITQANHAFLSLTADAYGKLSDDFVRFLWMLAISASTNSRLSQPSSQDFADLLRDSFAAQVGSSFSRTRVRVGTAVAKATAARFMPDSADDGLPLPVFLKNASRVSLSHVFLYVCFVAVCFQIVKNKPSTLCSLPKCILSHVSLVLFSALTSVLLYCFLHKTPLDTLICWSSPLLSLIN